MTQYTELLDKKAEELLLDDDNYEERLLEVATLFRGFDEAFTSFIKEHGYTGDLSDTPAKVEFLRDKFKALFPYTTLFRSDIVNYLVICLYPIGGFLVKLLFRSVLR